MKTSEIQPEHIHCAGCAHLCDYDGKTECMNLHHWEGGIPENAPCYERAQCAPVFDISMSQSRADKIRDLEEAVRAHRNRIDRFGLGRGTSAKRIQDALIVMFEGHHLAERLIREIVSAHMEVLMALEELYDSSDRTMQ